jgi:hypothetical protein
MSYVPIRPPFSLKFREMSKQNLKFYFRWFMHQIPQRGAELADALRQTPGFADWQPDFTSGSLNVLREWLAGQVETRNRSRGEIQEIEERLVFPMDIPAEELTDRTFSLAMDVGMYFSRVLLINHPSIKWEQLLGSRRFADFGQPVLSGFGPVPLNPVRVEVTLAYALASKEKTGMRLREIYDYWAQRVQQ